MIRLALRVLNRLYGHSPVQDFGPLALKACRTEFVGQGLSRRECNRRTNLIEGAFKWGVAEELDPGPCRCLPRGNPRFFAALAAPPRRARTLAHPVAPTLGRAEQPIRGRGGPVPRVGASRVPPGQGRDGSERGIMNPAASYVLTAGRYQGHTIAQVDGVHDGEGRAHLEWLVEHPDTPAEDRRAVCDYLKSSPRPPAPREWSPRHRPV